MRKYCGERLNWYGAVYRDKDCGYKIVDSQTRAIGNYEKELQKYTYKYKHDEKKADDNP